MIDKQIERMRKGVDERSLVKDIMVGKFLMIFQYISFMMAALPIGICFILDIPIDITFSQVNYMMLLTGIPTILVILYLCYERLKWHIYFGKKGD